MRDGVDRDMRLPTWALRSRRVSGTACVAFGLIGLIGLLALARDALAGIRLLGILSGLAASPAAWCGSAAWSLSAIERPEMTWLA